MKNYYFERSKELKKNTKRKSLNTKLEFYFSDSFSFNSRIENTFQNAEFFKLLQYLKL
jgi:hypothetical protein